MSHRPLELPEYDGLSCLQVGGWDRFSSLRDNVADNIADRNGTYSENTAFYWVWKNRPSAQVGFFHYRRFLIPPRSTPWFLDNTDRSYADLLPQGRGNYASGYIIKPERMYAHLADQNTSLNDGFSELLKTSDVILPKHNQLPETGFIGQYAACHPLYPFFDLLGLMAREDRSLAKRAYEFFAFHPRAYWNNLFVMPWDGFAAYCDFLFYHFFRLEQRLQLPDNPYQKRVYAFLSERLLNFWIYENSLRIAEVDWCMTEDIKNTRESHQCPGVK